MLILPQGQICLKLDETIHVYSKARFPSVLKDQGRSDKARGLFI